MSKTRSGFLMLFGLAVTIIGGQVAAWAGHHVGAPQDDWWYECMGWAGTIPAIGGLCAFFWGAKLFAYADSHKRAERDMYVLDSKTGKVTKRARSKPQ